MKYYNKTALKSFELSVLAGADLDFLWRGVYLCVFN